MVFDQNRRDDLAARAVLYALAEAGQRTGSTALEFGNPSAAIADGLDQRTVGKVLNRLVDEDGPLIDLLRPATGIKANVYSLVIPDRLNTTSRRRTWRKGKISGVRAAFRELGLAAVFVYAALGHHNGPASGRELASDARLGVQTTYDALATLQAFNLAVRSPTGWTVGPANLDRLAEAFGIVDVIRAQVDRYREERRIYWAMLGIVRLVDEAGTSIGTYDHDPPPESPLEDDASLVDMLETAFGVPSPGERRDQAG